MCGFFCITSSNGIHINREKILESFEYIKNRGPDSKGLFIHYINNDIEFIFNRNINRWYPKSEVFCLMGFSRLSIRGLDEKYNQPFMRNGNVTVFNGEIYNEEEISQNLNFEYVKGQSDVKTVNKLFKNNDFLNYFLEFSEGMYAIANYNPSNKEIIFLRDIFGIKPLYKTIKSNSLFLSSSPLVCNNLSEIEKSLSNKGVCNYLLFRATGSGQSIFSKISSVKNGVIYSFKDSKLNKLSSFDLKNIFFNDIKDMKIDTRKVLSSLKKSLLENCISDVDLTSTLSGGIDSSFIANFLSNSKIEHELFSVIVDEKSLSEEKYIDLVCNKLKVKTNKIGLSNNLSSDLLRKIVIGMEEPISHPNSIGIYKLCESIKVAGYKVLLAGEGADEMFCGYDRSYWDYLSCTIPHFMDPYNFKNKNIKIQIKKLIKGNLDGKILNIMSRLIFLDPNYVQRIVDKEYVKDSLLSLYEEISYNSSTLKKENFIVLHELKNYLPSLLIRADKMSMANSIEMRVPFLSKELLKNILLLNQSKRIKLLSFKGKEGCKKILLKRYLSEKFGLDFSYRRKQGFTVPVEEFINNSFAKECIEKSDFKDFIREIKVENKNKTDRNFIDKKIWPIFSLALSEVNFKKII